MKRILKKLRRRLRGQRTSRRKEQDHAYARPFGEQLEPRRLLSADLALWHNYALPEDVNGDGTVSLRDAAVLHSTMLNAPSLPIALQPAAASKLSPEGEGGAALFPDVSGDNILSPKDSRMVTGFLSPEQQGPGDIAVIDVRLYDPLTNMEYGVDHDAVTIDLQTGQTFQVRLYVEDIRDIETPAIDPTRMGVAQAFTDVYYVQTPVAPATSVISALGTDPVTPGTDFDNAFAGGTVQATVIEDVGGVENSHSIQGGSATPLGPGPFLLSSVSFTADNEGSLTFSSDVAGPGESLAVVLSGAPAGAPPVIVDPNDVFYDDLSVDVVPGPVVARDDFFDGQTHDVGGVPTFYSTVDEDSSVFLNVLFNDTVNSGGPLSITNVTTPSDGGMAVAVNDPTFGWVIQYTPKPNYISNPDPETFTYTATNTEASVDATVYATVVNVDNDPPTAMDDNVAADDPQYQTDEDTPLTFPGSLLTANDTDPEFTVLTVSSIGTDPPVKDNGNGTFTYTPPASFNSMQVGDPPRTDTYTYIVSDGTNTDTGTVTFTVTGVNDAPVVPAQIPAVTDDNTQIVADLDDLVTGGVVTDPEGDPIDFEGPVSGLSAMGATVTVDANNVLTYNPNASATLNALLPGDAPITDMFTIQVNDDHGGSSDLVFNVTVNPADDDMTVGPQDPLPAFTNTPVTFYAAEGPVAGQTPNIGQKVSDVDSDVRFDVPLTTDNGALIVRNADGSFTYDPNGVFDGVAYPATATDTFTYRVTSQSDPTDYHDIQVTVNLEVDVRMPNIEGAAIYSDDNNNGVFDTWERTIGGVKLELRGTDITGLDIGTRVAYTDANGGFSFDNLIRGNYVLRQYTPRFIVDDDGPGIAFDEIAINSPADAARDFFFGEFGLHPHYIVVNDYFGSTDTNGIMFGLDASGQQLWYSLHDGWGAANSVSAQMSADGRSLRVTVNGRAFSVSTVGNPDFLLRGTSPSGQGSVVQIYGSMNDYLL